MSFKMRPRKNNRKVALPCSERLSQSTNEKERESPPELGKSRGNQGLKSSKVSSARRHHRRNWVSYGKLFVKEGAYVFITGRRQKELDEAVKAISGHVSGVQGDVAKLAYLDRLYKTVSKVKGRIDTVFANAGVGEFVPFGAVSEEHFDKLFDINVRGTLFTVQKASEVIPVDYGLSGLKWTQRKR